MGVNELQKDFLINMYGLWHNTPEGGIEDDG